MSRRGRKATVKVAMALLASAIGSAVFATVYLTQGSTQALGAAMALALGALGAGLVVWSKRLMPQGPSKETRETFPLSDDDEERVTTETFTVGKEAVGRRRLLGGLLACAGGALGLVGLLPVRSLGPRPEAGGTGWGAGVRLVTDDGLPVRVDDLAVGEFLTAFPEGSEQRAETQVMLVRVDDAAVLAGGKRVDWAVEGNLAYSRVCTHAGCPVGMFQADAHLLLCPCHQAAFNVVEGGRTAFGPAPRPLPQLPLDVDADGVLVARSDFVEPVGPDRWRRG